MRGALFFGAVAIATAAAFACGSKVPTPQYTGQPTSALIPVPFPPPPARVEIIPKQTVDESVWIDGEWVWQTRRYAWRKGRWVVPPSGAKFAPWTTVRDTQGNLFVATGVWRTGTGDEVQEPTPVGQAQPKGATVTAPDGDDIPVGQPASSASATFVGRSAAAAARELAALDASGPPTLANDAAVSEQLLDASAAERSPNAVPSDASTP